MGNFLPPSDRRSANPYLPFGDQRTAPWYGQDILSVKQFSREDLEYIFAVAHEMRIMDERVGPVRWLLRRAFCVSDPRLQTKAFGLRFENPVGLAAGYDKDGRGIDGLACLGFGHLEVGTVTRRPQAGNPRPRVFRLPEDQALINRMGFPNAGAAALRRVLCRRRPPGVRLGVNIGKGRDTPLEQAAEDYLDLLRTFAGLADYIAVNVSSPNTLGLRRLQARNHLEGLLRSLLDERARLGAPRPVPLLVKIAPDLAEAELEDAVGAIVGAGADGILATNTTLARVGLRSTRHAEAGGLSGLPLRARALECVRAIVRLTGGRLPVVAVGGIFDTEDARRALDAGASLVQVYTGMVYQGPGIVRSILTGLSA
jgi:dihydroorotate dehydrogenase